MRIRLFTVSHICQIKPGVLKTFPKSSESARYHKMGFSEEYHAPLKNALNAECFPTRSDTYIYIGDFLTPLWHSQKNYNSFLKTAVNLKLISLKQHTAMLVIILFQPYCSSLCNHAIPATKPLFHPHISSPSPPTLLKIN